MYDYSYTHDLTHGLQYDAPGHVESISNPAPRAESPPPPPPKLAAAKRGFSKSPTPVKKKPAKSKPGDENEGSGQRPTTGGSLPEI